MNKTSKKSNDIGSYDCYFQFYICSWFRQLQILQRHIMVLKLMVILITITATGRSAFAVGYNNTVSANNALVWGVENKSRSPLIARR